MSEPTGRKAVGNHRKHLPATPVPRPMRAALAPAFLVAVVVAAGLAGTTGGAAGPTQTPTVATERPTAGQNGTALLGREELYAAVDESSTGSTASLYYVAENGSWFHASVNGSVGSPAPAGDAVPGVADETHEVGPDERPVYLWRVVSDDECDTTFYDASNASDASSYVIPSCPPPTTGATTTRPITQTTAGTGSATTTGTETTEDGVATSTVGQPGFGFVVSVLGLVGGLCFASRRCGGSNRTRGPK